MNERRRCLKFCLVIVMSEMVKVSFGIHQGKIKYREKIMRFYNKTAYFSYLMSFLKENNQKHYRIGWGVDVYFVKVDKFISLCRYVEAELIRNSRLKAAVIWRQKYETFLKEIGLEN